MDRLRLKTLSYTKHLKFVGVKAKSIIPKHIRCFSQASESNNGQKLELFDKTYDVDHMTNVTPSIMKKLGSNLHNRKKHPIYLIRQRIQEYFYRSYVGRTGNPLYAVFDNLSPVVPLAKNFDNLLVPPDHPSRHPKDSYYVNQNLMLRAHTTCHTCDIISAGLDRFLTVGDVYRRDEIDRTHYPVFHQMDGTRLFSAEELFQRSDHGLKLFESGGETVHKQAAHTEDTLQLLSIDLKKTLLNLTQSLFGKGGVNSKVGWAFGLGLERLAMKLYSIPDVRLFWSEDTGFLSQFNVDDCQTPIKYKEISKFPQLAQDISFWLTDVDSYSSNDFYDLARTVGGELVEQVEVIDTFTHPKSGRTSHTYRVTYRHMHRNLTTQEINQVQQQLRSRVEQDLLGTVRV